MRERERKERKERERGREINKEREKEKERERERKRKSEREPVGLNKSFFWLKKSFLVLNKILFQLALEPAHTGEVPEPFFTRRLTRQRFQSHSV